MPSHRRTHRRLRAAAVVTALLSLLALLSAPYAAQAESVSGSKASLSDVRRKADEARRSLEAGTRRLERLEAEAGDLRRRATRAEQRSTALATELSDLHDDIGTIAAAAYREPLGGGQATLLFGQTADDVAGTLRALGYLDIVAARRGDILRRTQVTRLAAENAKAEARQLAKGAADASAAAARAVADLRKESLRVAVELERAVAAYEAAVEKARLERERLARERAERERAARNAITSLGGSCTGGDGREWGGYPNGFIPESALSPLDHAPGHRLRCDAAGGFNRMTAAKLAETGSALCVTDSYRSYDDQARLYRSKPSMAAVPGTSNHGWALAVDLCGGVERWGSAAHTWMKDNAGRFGWVHPGWARQGGSRPEPWHWEYGNIS